MASCSMVLALLLVCSAPQEAEERTGKLQGFEEAFQGNEKNGDDSDGAEKRREGLSRSSHRHHRSDSDTFYGVMLELLLEGLILYPLADHDLRYGSYPFAGGWDGYYLGPEQSAKGFAVELQPYAMWLEEDLRAFGVSGNARLYSGADLGFNLVQYEEDLGTRTDRLTLQQYELNYGPGGGPRRYHWTVGWGVAFLDGEDRHGSGSLQSTLDWFPGDPFSFRLHAGVMPFEHATLTDLQAEVRLHLHRFAFTAGVRSLLSSEGDDLTGLLLGVALYW